MVSARRRVGDFGERIAARRLEAGAYTILDRNIRVPSGEIDILARDGTDLVFVEVRSRRGAPGLAAESVTGAKLERMWQCAMDYCLANSEDPEQIRLDLVVVEMDGRGVVTGIEHFRALEVEPG